MKIMSGYTKSGKRVEITLENEHVYIKYISSGRKVKWNDWLYSEDEYHTIVRGLTAEGLRREAD